MHSGDIWQVFNRRGEPIRGEGWDASKDNPTKEDGVILGGSVVFLYRQNQRGELELLWQKRADKIDNGGLWDFSAGGHANLGESFAEAAVREAFEEIGAKIETYDLQFVVTRIIRGLMYRAVYLVDWTGKPDDFCFDDGEVSEVRWVPFTETKDFRKNFAKPSVRKDKASFHAISDWFEDNGLI